VYNSTGDKALIVVNQEAMFIGLFNKLFNLPLRCRELLNALSMAKRTISKSGYIVTGTIVLCAPDYFFAFYDHRSEMTANGETVEECLRNLREMYEYVLREEERGKKQKPQADLPLQLPADWNVKKFTDTVSLI
jgi:predicted RNase H-like HicB family nuclease